MSFPENPNVGDTHTLDDTVYTYNGRRWDRTTIGVNNSTTYGRDLAIVALLHRIAHLEALVNQGLLILD